MFLVSLNKFFYKLSICLFLLVLFGPFVVNPVYALDRAIPTTTEIKVPEGTLVTSTCPTFPDLEGHISICGIVKTIDINTRDGVQYAQEPIKGATVAAYLGVKYDTNLGALSRDPNGTGELVGLIERLYTYDITNADGRFVVPVPKGAGTNGFIFLGFFCGENLKDLYMINTSQDLPYMPVSLACPPEVTPASVNAIPAPPSINYADRTNFVSCEDSNGSGGVAPVNEPGSFVEGDPGMVKDASKTVSIPLQETELDNTRLNALVRQPMEFTCNKVGGTGPTCNSPNPQCLSCRYSPTVPGFCVPTWHLPCPNDPCEYRPGTPPGYAWDGSLRIAGDPVFVIDHPWPSGVSEGPPREVPRTSSTYSRRDLEGFTHTSMGYSFQAISSLNCGIAGCYNTYAPTTGHDRNKYLPKDMVDICNTSPFPPLNCWGPGIQMTEPGEWSRSYELQRMVEVYPGIVLQDITQPQYSAIGQLMQEILNELHIALTVGPNDTPQTVTDMLTQLIANIIDNPNDTSVITSFQTVKAGWDDFVTLLNNFNNAPLIDKPGIALQIAVSGITEASSFYTAMGNLSAHVLWYAIPQDVRNAFDAIYADVTQIVNLALSVFTIPLPSLDEIGAAVQQILDLTHQIADNLNVLTNWVLETANFFGRIAEAIYRISHLHITTVTSNYFPYSLVLNYDINKRFREAYLNKPINDSFVNYGGASMCENQGEGEIPRQSASSVDPATYPFNACYGAWLLGEDTYSTQKALYLTTKNTGRTIRGETNDPPVSKFLGPNEPVGAEVAPKEGELPVTPVTDTPKVGGKGYWRLGIVQTMCSGGQNDWENYLQQNYIDYPVLGAYGEEGVPDGDGVVRAAPAYSPIPAPVPPY